MARRVIIHVGTPKTGTSFVQDILFTHRAALRDEGIFYFGDRHDAHFLAALDLMELPWGGLEAEAAGSWDQLATAVRHWPETAIISHEILGHASRDHVARALESLGDAEIHLVLSARDLVRQIPAEWQENVKHRRTKTWHDYLEDLTDPSRPGEISQWFWAVQEVPDILDRWGATLPRERIHLVTVPRPGAAPTELWHRFASVLGIDPTRYQPEEERTNSSLGVAESAMVRRLNTHLNNVLPNHHYRTYVREMLVHRNLSTNRISPRLALPPEVHAWATGLSRSWVSDLALRGYHVVGSLDELLPDGPQPYTDPDHPDEAQVAEAAIRGLALMTNETARLRDVEIELHGVVQDLMGQLDAFHGTRSYRAKEKLVALARTNLVARTGLAGYRRLRGKNSRST